MKSLRRSLQSAAAAACLLAGTAVAAEPESGLITSAEVAAAPDRAWQQFLAERELASTYAAYEVLPLVGYSLDGVDAELCAEHAPTLDAAVAAAPVSIALHRAAMLCAEALENEDAAEAALAALGALSGLELARVRQGAWPAPVRVLGPPDIYALLHSAGLEYRYEYFTLLRAGRYFPQHVAVWDPERAVERHLAFDYIDSVHAIDRSDLFSGYPVQRQLQADAFTQAQAQGGEAHAIDWQAVGAASAIAAPADKVSALRPAALLGGIQSIRTWMVVCARSPFAGCEEGLIDALLPLAEMEQAMAMAMLAHAYWLGIGLEADTDAALQLLNAADKRWENQGATADFIQMWSMTRPDEPVPDWLRGRLRDAATRGNVSAAAFAAAVSLMRDDTDALTDDELAGLAYPDNNGMGKGYALLAAFHEKRENTKESGQWRQRAAMAGDADSQAIHAMTLLREQGSEASAESERWLRVAAQGGNAFAMRYLGYRSVLRSDWADAEGWMLGAAMAGNIEALLTIAGVYEEEHPGVQGTRQQALDMYRALDRDNDSAEARRRLAAMAMEGRGMEADPVQAERWLLQDAERGDHESEVMLGVAYLDGKLGEPDETTGKAWIDRALDAGEHSAYLGYGSWLYYRKKTPEARAQAIELWARGHEAGSSMSTNNLAWALCTSPDDAIFDPSRGLDAALGLAEEIDLPAAHLDTIAACHAAAGDYARAVEFQHDAIGLLSKSDIEADDDGEEGYRARLRLYGSEQRYIDSRE